MAKKKIYYLNPDSVPEKMFIGGKEEEITGIFMPYSPRALFCAKCGHMIDCRDRRESSPSFEGQKCPECGAEHTANSIIYGFSYVGSTINEEKVEFSTRKGEIRRTMISYKLESTGENLFSVATMPAKVDYFPLSHLSERWVPKAFKQQLVDKYGDQIHPMIKVLLETELKTTSSYASTYYNRLDQVQDIMDNNPALLTSLLEAFRSDSSMTYEKFEQMYPEYLLPLDARLIKDYNPIEDRNRSWSKPYIWKPVSAYANYEALTCVVAYYKRDLISHHVMRQILEKPAAFKNPTFIPAFKANYLQFNGFLDDLIEDGRKLESTIFDIKAYYIKKSREYFIEQGYTPAQIDAALDSTKNGQFGLAFLNAIGSTRRKKK
jgi:hypothetical protein